MLTKDQILGLTDKALLEVEIPEWGGSVFIRGMTIEDVDYFATLDNESQSLEKMVMRFVCDAEGNLLFTEADIPELKKKTIQAFKRIMDEVRKFNSLDTAEKNSQSTPE